ncbi:BAHD acyltransferase At5g47980-like [Rhodamnia argentea]|uniref:BAHD acyltransferase At5g47980-like n=1 Tax=Rhodamnia argentea TaxID=178133 RepID=A0A8B8NXX1_9MYRT|nr:BAHD acyltransferase At5g47980-like [Rhodamnia argentea]
MTIEVDIVKRETIKPSSPTPPELRHFKLSLFDQFYPIFYTPLILFYAGSDPSEAAQEKSRRLTTSLPEVLTRFYPFAGRIVDNLSLGCVDQGAEYLEAVVNCDLSRVLKEPDTAVLRTFLPATADIERADATTMPLVLVQANFFECGGSAIGLCVMHKVADAEALCTFVNAWAGTATGAITEAMIPEFRTASMFPPLDSLANSFPSIVPAKEKCVRRRFLLESSKVAALRKRIEGPGGPASTAVEAVSALLWKCSATASRKKKANLNKMETPRTTMLSQTVNLRRRMEPQLPSNLAGNLAGYFLTRADEREMEMRVLAVRLREALEGYCESHVKRLQGDGACAAICEETKEFGELLGKSLVMDEMDFYSCTSWCRFPFYEADFGWGRPVWACQESADCPNFFMLMDARDSGGIEVCLTLREEDMALFEQDPDLLEFASLNPTIRG